MNKNFSILIPEFYSKLIDWADPKDPLRKMAGFDPREEEIHKYEIVDPIGDKTKTVIPGLIHRYPDRLLVNLTSACAMHCRFCFRKNLLHAVPSPDLKKIFAYLKKHKEIWEVIFSGGDPLMIPNKLLSEVLVKLNEIEHIKTVRFHTRIPVVDPNILIKNKTIQLLKKSLDKGKKLTIIIHINHAKEITKEFQKTVKEFQRIGALVLTQTVLLKNVNDNAETLSELFRGLIESGVKPYYLHHLDAAKGTHHFRVSVEKGKKIFQKLRGNLSSICLPEYVVDIPGGYGKIPVFWLKKMEKGDKKNIYTATNFEGKKIKYVDFA
ncbi:MAG: KamA family radical SAM protein [Candidatus Gracilibacteria bacterium]